MKAISLIQPWADLVMLGIKTIETRSWTTNFRGDLLICSSKQTSEYSGITPSALDRFFALKEMPIDLHGHALCIVEVMDVRRMLEEDREDACCLYMNKYAWELRNVRRIEPFMVKGRQRFFEVSNDLIILEDGRKYAEI